MINSEKNICPDWEDHGSLFVLLTVSIQKWWGLTVQKMLVHVVTQITARWQFVDKSVMFDKLYLSTKSDWLWFFIFTYKKREKVKILVKFNQTFSDIYIFLYFWYLIYTFNWTLVFFYSWNIKYIVKKTFLKFIDLTGLKSLFLDLMLIEIMHCSGFTDLRWR